MSGSTSPVTSVEDYGKGPQGEAARWITELELADKETKDWHHRANVIEKRYRDERSTAQSAFNRGAGSYRFNVLWSNVQTLMPAIYARPPKPVVGRRYRDRDPIGRAASQIVERGLDYLIECEDLHHTIKLAVQDFLLPGRGVVWLRYEPKFTGPTPDGQSEDVEGEAHEAAEDAAEAGATPAAAEVAEDDDDQVSTAPDAPDLAYEQVECDYIHWSDFQCSPARVWDEVRWVARRVFMTRAELRERFKDSLTEQEIMMIPLDWKPKNLTDQDVTVQHQAFERATVWEIWNKDDRKVYWVSTGFGAKPLDVAEDPLRLEGFFPCPRPLSATMTNGTIVPVPDYTEYQDQADQLDDLTGRMAMVTKALKVTGLYPSEAKDIARIFQEGSENMLLPVDNWQAFAENGGLEKMIALMPVDRLASVLRDLTEIRGVIKNDLYEITGIADIVRGSTQATETATAQEIKGRYATMRLSDKQQEVARFVRDVLRMMAEIMCEHFQPQTLLLMSDYMFSDDPGIEGQQKVISAIQMLKDDKVRGFRIDIEDESTIAQDDQAEKQSRMEFLQAMSGFLQQAIPAAQQVPEMAPLLGKMMMFGVRAFRAGRDLETSIEDALAQLEQSQKAAAQQPKPPSPEQMKAEAEAQKAQADLQMSQQQSEVDSMKVQAELAIKQMEMQAKEAAEQRAHEFAMADLELKAKQQEIDAKKAAAEMRRMDAEGEKAESEAGIAGIQAQREQRQSEQESADMADRLDKIEGGLMEVAATTAQTVQQSHEALMTAMRTLGGPRTIVRGPDGKAIRSEPVAMN